MGGRGPSAKEMFYKTQICSFWQAGRCNRGAQCSFAHGHSKKADLPDFYRTRPCPDVLATGSCSKGDACCYAHSRAELRSSVMKPPSPPKDDGDEELPSQGGPPGRRRHNRALPGQSPDKPPGKGDRWGDQHFSQQAARLPEHTPPQHHRPQEGAPWQQQQSANSSLFAQPQWQPEVWGAPDQGGDRDRGGAMQNRPGAGGMPAEFQNSTSSSSYFTPAPDAPWLDNSRGDASLFASNGTDRRVDWNPRAFDPNRVVGAGGAMAVGPHGAIGQPNRGPMVQVGMTPQGGIFAPGGYTQDMFGNFPTSAPMGAFAAAGGMALGPFQPAQMQAAPQAQAFHVPGQVMPVGQQIGQPGVQPIGHPIGQPGIQPIGQPVMQPIGQPVGQQGQQEMKDQQNINFAKQIHDAGNRSDRGASPLDMFLPPRQPGAPDWSGNVQEQAWQPQPFPQDMGGQAWGNPGVQTAVNFNGNGAWAPQSNDQLGPSLLGTAPPAGEFQSNPAGAIGPSNAAPGQQQQQQMAATDSGVPMPTTEMPRFHPFGGETNPEVKREAEAW